MTTATPEPTIDQLDLADVSIPENETEIIQSPSIQSPERRGSNLTGQPPIDADKSSKFFQRLFTAVIVSIGLAIYVAAPPAPSHATLNQLRLSALQGHRVISLVKQHQTLPE